MLKSPTPATEIPVQTHFIKIADVAAGKLDLGEEGSDVRCTFGIEKEVVRAEPGEEPGAHFFGGRSEGWDAGEEEIICAL